MSNQPAVASGQQKAAWDAGYLRDNPYAPRKVGDVNPYTLQPYGNPVTGDKPQSPFGPVFTTPNPYQLGTQWPSTTGNPYLSTQPKADEKPAQSAATVLEGMKNSEIEALSLADLIKLNPGWADFEKVKGTPRISALRKALDRGLYRAAPDSFKEIKPQLLSIMWYSNEDSIKPEVRKALGQAQVKALKSLSPDELKKMTYHNDLLLNLDLATVKALTSEQQEALRVGMKRSASQVSAKEIPNIPLDVVKWLDLSKDDQLYFTRSDGKDKAIETAIGIANKLGDGIDGETFVADKNKAKQVLTLLMQYQAQKKGYVGEKDSKTFANGSVDRESWSSGNPAYTFKDKDGKVLMENVVVVEPKGGRKESVLIFNGKAYGMDGKPLTLDKPDSDVTKGIAESKYYMKKDQEKLIKDMGKGYGNFNRRIADVQHLLEGQDLLGIDFSNSNFDGVDLSKLKLQGSKLDSAQFKGAKFNGANLKGVDFKGAYLGGANFDGAKFDGASLIGANFFTYQWGKTKDDPTVTIPADLKGADLSGAILKRRNYNSPRYNDGYDGADFKYAKLGGAKLNGVDFSNTALRDADVNGADFKGAKLQNTDLAFCDLKGAKLGGCNLKGVYFGYTKLGGADLNGADFNGAIMTKGYGSTWIGSVDLNGADFKGAKLGGADWKFAKFDGAKLAGADLKGADFTKLMLNKVDLNGVDFNGATLKETFFATKSLRGVKLQGANLEGADLSIASLAGVNLNGIDFKGVKFGFDTAVDADFTGAKLAGAKFDRSSFKGAKLAGINMGEVDWNGANLNGADLSEAIISGEGMDFSQGALKTMSLTQINFTKIKMPKANFTGRTQEGLSFDESDLTGSNMTKTVFQNATFKKAKLNELNTGRGEGAEAPATDWTGMTMTDSEVKAADLRNAILDKAKVQGSDLSETNFDGASLSGAEIKKSKLVKSRFSKTSKLAGAQITESDLSEARFEGSDMRKARLTGSILNDTVFKAARLQGADLSQIKGNKTDFSGSDLTQAKLIGAELAKSSFANATLTDADLSNGKFGESDFRGASLQYAILTGANLSKIQFDAGKTGNASQWKGAYYDDNTQFPGIDNTNADARAAFARKYGLAHVGAFRKKFDEAAQMPGLPKENDFDIQGTNIRMGDLPKVVNANHGEANVLDLWQPGGISKANLQEALKRVKEPEYLRQVLKDKGADPKTIDEITESIGKDSKDLKRILEDMITNFGAFDTNGDGKFNKGDLNKLGANNADNIYKSLEKLTDADWKRIRESGDDGTWMDRLYHNTPGFLFKKGIPSNFEKLASGMLGQFMGIE